jgi:hypothetical protein
MTTVSDPIKLLRLANPVPRGSLRDVAAERAEDLLVRLRADEVSTPSVSAPQRRWRRLAVAAIVAGALALTGVAIAAGLGAFDGISAADRPQTTKDVLDPQTVANLQRTCSSNVPDLGYRPNCNLVLSSARLVSQLPSGLNVYVIADTQGDLCVLLPAAMMSCGSALSQSSPITTASFQASSDQQPIVYGVALDGVTAVSFELDGQEVTVPVKDNVWAYEGASLPEAHSLTAHFDNGATVTLHP